VTDKKLTAIQGGIIFSVIEILFILYLFFNPFDNYFVAGAIGEFAVILLPAVLFVIIFRKSIKENFRIRKVGAVNSIIIVITMWFTIPITVSLSYISVILVNLVFKNNIIKDIPIPTNLEQLLLSVIVIGGFAAICEEALFRGALLSSIESIGIKKSFVFISILFALFHFSFEKAIGVFVLSLLISYIVYRTNSIFAGMLAHFINNTTAVLISFVTLKLIPNITNSQKSMTEIINQSTSEVYIMLIVLGIVALISATCNIYTRTISINWYVCISSN